MLNSADKKLLRQKFSKQRKILTQTERKRANTTINQKLISLPEVVNANGVAAYISDGIEVDLTTTIKNLLTLDKKVYLPRYCPHSKVYEMALVNNLSHDLTEGKYGLLEPTAGKIAATKNELNSMTWLVPGVAFDKKGNRLGRGGGFFDRLLTFAQGSVIGVFYSCQEAKLLPIESHDHNLTMVITENY